MAEPRTADGDAARGRWRARVAGLAAFALAAGLGTPVTPAGSPAAYALGTAALMIVWWSTSAAPLWVTGLVPLVVFPIVGVHAGGPIERAGGAASPYLSAYVLLFFGGMTIAAALQETGLHRRLALSILARTRASPLRVLAGVFAATATVSMWISNTAAATLVLPIALSLLAEVELRTGPRPRFAAALVLAVAWGASIGGLATKIGTPTNMQLAAFFSTQGREVSFGQFAFVGLGLCVLLAPCAVAILWRGARTDAPPAEALARGLAAAAPAPARWSRGERATGVVFAATALTWIAAAPIARALAAAFPAHGIATRHVEAGAALIAALALCVWRPGGTPLLSRASLRATPWSALLLIGGSFALADGIEKSGLSAALAPAFDSIGELPLYAQGVAVSGIAVLVSAFASNTATIAILLPLLSASAPPGREATLLFTGTLAASCDFALPAGTPPNAIAFATGRVPFLVMLRTGIALDVVSVVVAALWCQIAVRYVVG